MTYRTINKSYQSPVLSTSLRKRNNHRHSEVSPILVVAVLSTVRLDSQNNLPAGKEARIYQEKLAMAKQYGILMYLFFAQDVNWANKTITGYTFLNNAATQGHWIRNIFPFPDVVYNRIRYRKTEMQRRVKEVLQRFDSDPNIHLFNTRFLDKWEVHQALAIDPASSEFLPPTKLLSLKNLKYFIDNYSEVFIKPRNNNAGRGIIKIICKPKGIYHYCQSGSSSPSWMKCLSFQSLWNQLSNLLADPDKYLVQTGISLCRLNGQVFDMRAQVQKDGNGKWVFTGINVRVATENRFVTYPKVGKKIAFDKLLSIISESSREFIDQVNLQLLNLYHSVPNILDRNLGLSLGILSIDIGIDTQGKVWLIEVSSKSDSFDEIDIRKRHFHYLMEYFQYITR